MSHTYWLQLTAGQGPDECELAVSHLLRHILAESIRHNLKTDVIENIPGKQPKSYASVLLRVQGDEATAFINKWAGTVQWICNSPYRPNHKRKNWFVGVDALELCTIDDVLIKQQDIIFETMRASGPGGQHVNTTNSAVRAIHKATGITVIAREERSQHMNKKLALARIILQLQQKKQQSRAGNKEEQWLKHYKLERGNPIKIFLGEEFKPTCAWHGAELGGVSPL